METQTISQDFNNNVNNENTELCFYCRKYKAIKEFENPNKDKATQKNKVCNGCYIKYLRLCRKLKVEFIERMRKEPHFSGWYCHYIDHKDTFAIKDNKEIFIMGYYPEEEHYNFVAHERAEIFDLKIQFLKSNCKTMVLYGNIKELKNYEFWFDLSKGEYFYYLSGNCIELSNAFDLRTTNINLIWSLIEKYNKLTDKQKERILRYIEDKHHYFSKEDYVGKLVFKNYRFYDKEDKPRIKLFK